MTRPDIHDVRNNHLAEKIQQAIYDDFNTYRNMTGYEQTIWICAVFNRAVFNR